MSIYPITSESTGFTTPWFCFIHDHGIFWTKVSPGYSSPRRRKWWYYRSYPTLRGIFGKGLKPPTTTGKEKKRKQKSSRFRLERGYVFVARRENIIHEYMYIKIDICICILYIYPGTSGCAKLSLEVETTLFFAVLYIFCSFPKITPFHVWGFGC